MIPERQFRTPLFDALVALAEAKKVSFHTPGHKSGKGISTRFRQFVGPKIFTIDLTTLDEVDCLQRPVGVIKEAQELAAEAYGADHSFFLINGTTVGNQAMILATARPGEEVLVARNAHKSILAGVLLSGSIPRFFLPEFDPELGIAWNITPFAFSSALERHPEAKILCITSPNYYGVAADLSSIIAQAKGRGMIVLVDEAHGPHLRFHPDLPKSALESGADMCVQSTHKIMGAMTQASMLHVRGEKIDLGRLRGVIHILQSTSPSYILMASLDLARMQMATEGPKLLGKAIELAEWARARINQIDGLYCLEAEVVERAGPYSLDITKLTISTKSLGLSGFQVSSLLNAEFGIQVEMADLANLLVIVSIGDRKDDLDRLVSALMRISSHRTLQPIKPLVPPVQADRMVLSPRDAYFAPYEYVEIKDSVGRVSSEVVTLYPPGIPLLVPGEEISPEAVDYLLSMASHGARIDGIRDGEPPCLRVLRN